MIDQKEFTALLTLLDDNDVAVFNHVSEKLVSFGNDAIPLLMQAWEKSMEPFLQSRIENIIHHIQFKETLASFQNWTQNINADPLEGALLVAKYQYPDLDENVIWHKIERIKHDIWVELQDYLTPMEQVNIFNQVFYKHYNFSGKSVEIDDPQSYMLNIVIESKKGNSLSLGLLYLGIAHQLGIPVYGINLPSYYCLAYTKNELTEETINQFNRELEKEIIFYINPLNNGLIFTKDEIKDYLAKMDIQPKIEHFLPISTIDSVRLLIMHLKASFKQANAQEKSDELDAFLEIIQNHLSKD